MLALEVPGPRPWKTLARALVRGPRRLVLLTPRVPLVPCASDRTVVAAGAPLGLADQLVGEEGEAVTDGPGVDEADGFLAGGLAEEALAGPEHDREDD